ncbi:hypothetical protein, partial [Bradyrhizobium yuanmingense]|uniref:hypothetical protein n=1 Tax=Bradyrhizobium yuanmingense TaxID=108015 RepID=UPI00223EEC51
MIQWLRTIRQGQRKRPNQAAWTTAETAKVKSMPGNRAGNDNAHDSVASDDSSGPAKTAEPGGLDHSNPHASERESA